jgi:26S proteasome regulatory subunit N12
MSLDSLIAQLDACVQQGQVEEGQRILTHCKIALLQEPSRLEQACHILEHGVLLAVAAGDLEAFRRHMAQLQPYYYNITTDTPPSPRKRHVIGLHLMHLLVANRLSEFHSELELLTETEAADPLIQFPIGLERKLMVGIYDEVLEGQVPDPSYQYFMNALWQTVRDSIADCMEVSYATLSVKDAAHMMKCKSIEEWTAYTQESRDDWIVTTDSKGEPVLTFQPPSTVAQATDIPSMDYIQRSLTYATEMERII